jgi:hypothetical protein
VVHPDPAAPPDGYIRIGDSSFAPGRAFGTAASAQLDASWDLEFEASEPPLWHLPRWAYNAPLPRTKLLSPHPEAVFSGRIRAGERSIEVRGWPGTIGHNWGSEHAQRAIWIHGDNFKDQEAAWLDLSLGRVRLGPLTTPWIANGALSLNGPRHRLGGLGRLRSTAVDEAVEHCRFTVRGDGIAIGGTVGAARRDFVGWIYEQPKGGERRTINCSIADLRLEIHRRQHEPLRLEVAGGAAYELQMEERHPEIPVQPSSEG